MRVRQVGGDQGSCDVKVAICPRVCVCVCVCGCVCVCVCVCVFVSVRRMYHGCFSRYTVEMESKERSNCPDKLWQRELQM